MRRVLISFSVFLMASMLSFSQTSINDYKYVIIPNQFDFLKEKDQYQINSLTKFLFNKYGYKAFLQDDELPSDLRNNGCLGLLADVQKESGLLKTKLLIDLKDCNGRVVASSQVGETREKEFSKAYNLALRDAFTTFQNMEYSYQPNDAIVSKGTAPTTPVASNEQEEINRLKEEIKTLKEEKSETLEIEQPVAKEPIQEKAIDKAPEKIAKSDKSDSSNFTGMLYAQPLENGYQLVDSTPKVVMVLLNTGVKDVYSVKDGDAIVYKKDAVWMYSEEGSVLKGKPIDIKF